MYAAITAVIVIALCGIFAAVRFATNKKRKRGGGIILIPVTADDSSFERRVKACCWEQAFADPASAMEILLVIMEQSPNAYAALRLANEYSEVRAVHISALSDYLMRNYAG